MNHDKENPLSVSIGQNKQRSVSVDRALYEFRRGRLIVIEGIEDTAVLALAAEVVTPEILQLLSKETGQQPALTISSNRAAAIGLSPGNVNVVTVTTKNQLSAEQALALSNPLNTKSVFETAKLNTVTEKSGIFDCQKASVMLAKFSRLLPAAITADIVTRPNINLADWASKKDFLLVKAQDIFQSECLAAQSLQIVSEANVPLEGAVNTRIIAFRPQDGGLEHLAIIIGKPPKISPILTRIHSECFTGDLLGSLRCDCGDQLQGALHEIISAGTGILLYLAQEGRGIGLVNKLRAYRLQDQGFDTMEANEQLGFEYDERIYLPSVSMLNCLGFRTVKLMTNNPTKVQALEQLGISVTERVPHKFPSNRHNEFYLKTKAVKGGHYF
ncbi:MAG: GTP cyclohydrolase-2 [Alphaproteobacteria bacterium MarineAlpha3_Bin5]|nr:MAG: GTP cyclohydrolase-2 [Alphaproteobacteria bacterium MarineAlpha3_Bin5]